MEIKSTGIDGLFLIEPQVFRDDRGFFLESYQAQRYHDAGMNVDLIHMKMLVMYLMYAFIWWLSCSLFSTLK